MAPRIEKPRRAFQQRPLFKEEEPHCAGCGGLDGTLQWCAIVRRGRLEVHNAWLHPTCERDYLAKIDPV